MTPHGPRDRTTLRRSVIAGAVVWAVCAAGLGAVALIGGLGWDAVPYDLALALPFGAVAGTLWLWLANLLDVLAGEPPSRRRWLWALAATVGTTLALPALLLASVGAAG